MSEEGDVPPYIQTLCQHFSELLKMTRDRVKYRRCKDIAKGEYFGFTASHDLYFGHRGRCEPVYEFINVGPPCRTGLLTTMTIHKKNLPEAGDVIYHFQNKNKPCWFLASDYPGLDEFLGYLKGIRREPPLEYAWVAEYFEEDVQRILQRVWIERAIKKIPF